MRIRAVIHAAFLWAVSSICGTLSAQTISVQSGDHLDFTRLVLPIGADREWGLDQRPDGNWQLTLTPAASGFDISGAFEIIGRDRLSQLTSQDGLTLELACSCDVSSFRHDTRYLVIDIADPDPDAPTTQPPIEAFEQAPVPSPLPDLANLLNQPGNLPDVALLPASADDTAPDHSEPNPRLAEAAQIMAEQLARAAASGLLDVALDEPLIVGDPVETAVSQPPNEVELVANPSEPHHTPFPNLALPAASPPQDTIPLRAETAFDTALRLNQPIGPPRPEASCDGAPFAVADWSNGDGLVHELGTLRLALYDERDVLSTDAVVDLARHYLSYGFGAEARFWLERIESPPEALLHLSDLVDGADTAPFTPVDAPEECSDGELIWRYLAGAVTTSLNGDDTAAIQRGFNALPTQLRDQMGPQLAVRLHENGLSGAARNIRDVLHRGGRMSDTALRLLDLEIGIALDASLDQTREHLAEALRDDGGNPVAVLTRTLAFERSNGTLPQRSHLVTADALIRENGGGPETDTLWQEALLGRAALGEIDEALRRLSDSSRSEDARAVALTLLIAERVAVSDTATLAILAHTYGTNWRPEGSAEGRIQVQAIAALRAEGLFEAAQILQDVRRPLILPAPPTSTEADEDPATIAWRDSDWPRLAETGIGAHADIAARLANLATQDLPPDLAEQPPNLTQLNGTVEDSRNLRATIANLLAAPALPE